jgi:hypothetical protein
VAFTSGGARHAGLRVRAYLRRGRASSRAP